MSADPNTQLGPFVEGLVIGAIDMPRLHDALRALGWSAELVELNRHAFVLVSPSGLRWRIVAQLVEDDAADV